jgi:hypothetical protein
MLVRFYDGAILPRALTKIVEGEHKVLFTSHSHTRESSITFARTVSARKCLLIWPGGTRGFVEQIRIALEGQTHNPA